MAKHQLIISDDQNPRYPVRSEAGQSKATSHVVVNWKGTWEPGDQPETYLVVAPGDEIEIVLSSEMNEGASLWLFDEMEHKVPLLSRSKSQTGEERVDIKRGSKVVQVKHALAGDPRELRYYLRTSPLREHPPIIVGQGDPGTLTASKP